MRCAARRATRTSTTSRAAGGVARMSDPALIRAINWFNPLVHLGAFYARVDQELACDAAVAERFPGEGRTYAEAMV